MGTLVDTSWCKKRAPRCSGTHTVPMLHDLDFASLATAQLLLRRSSTHVTVCVPSSTPSKGSPSKAGHKKKQGTSTYRTIQEDAHICTILRQIGAVSGRHPGRLVTYMMWLMDTESRRRVLFRLWGSALQSSTCTYHVPNMIQLDYSIVVPTFSGPWPTWLSGKNELKPWLCHSREQR
jgi:hypothetical protein